jgi:hypothetical protein
MEAKHDQLAAAPGNSPRAAAAAAAAEERMEVVVRQIDTVYLYCQSNLVWSNGCTKDNLTPFSPYRCRRASRPASWSRSP